MPPSGTEFPLTSDHSTRIISAAVCALLLLVPAAAQNAAFVCLSLAIIFLAYAFSPRGYRVAEAGAGQVAQEAEPGRSRMSIGGWIGAAVAVVSLGVVAFALLYSPGPPSYTLTPNELTIHDRFYPVTVEASDVDIGHIRVVDIIADKEWRPTRRTNGFANGRYRAGWFQVASGRKVRMYWAEGERLVLLPPKGGGPAVLFEAREPEKFVDRIRLEWAGHS